MIFARSCSRMAAVSMAVVRVSMTVCRPSLSFSLFSFCTSSALPSSCVLFILEGSVSPRFPLAPLKSSSRSAVTPAMGGGAMREAEWAGARARTHGRPAAAAAATAAAAHRAP